MNNYLINVYILYIYLEIYLRNYFNAFFIILKAANLQSDYEFLADR